MKTGTAKGVIHITERVKTFEGACREVGIDSSEWIKDKEALRLEKDVVAYMKLRIICKALNEGWKPTLEKDEYRYVPVFSVYSSAEINSFPEKWVEKYHEIFFKGKKRCLFLSIDGYSASHFFSEIATYLCLKDKKLAIYCGEHFIDIWFEFLFPDFTLTKKNNW